MVEVVGVDVPGVPVAGPVLVELEQVAERSGGEDLPVEVDVEDAGQPAVVVPLQSEVAVGHPPVADFDRGDRRPGGVGLVGGVDRRPPERGDVDEVRPAGDVDDFPAAEGRGVEDDGGSGEAGGVDRSGEGVERRGRHRSGPAGDLGQLGLGLLGHPPDRRPGQDVVELVGEEQPPGGAELGRGVEAARPTRQRRRPQLGRLERRLPLAIAPLDGRLAGERAPVLLQVQLAGPHRERRRVGFDGGEEGRRRLEGDGGNAVERTDPLGRLEHLPGGAAAAVAVAEGVDRALLPGAAEDLPDRHVAVVGVGRREVGPHAGAVDALPPERVVGKAVGVVPGELLGDEPVDAGGGHDLGQGGGVAEGVGQPQLPALDAEALGEVPLAEDDLAHQRLARGQVAVGLHPHPAHRHELAGADPGGDAGEQLRVALLDPGQVLGRRAHEAVVGERFHQRDGGGECAGALADGLPQGPQPGRVDVGVADGRDPGAVGRPGRGVAVGGRAGPGPEERGQGRPGGGGRPGDVGRIDEGAGGAQRGLGVAGSIRAGFPVGGEADGQPEVAGQRRHRRAADGQLAAAQDEAGGPARVGPQLRPVEARHPVLRGRRVGRRFDVEVDGSAAGGGVHDRRGRMLVGQPEERDEAPAGLRPGGEDQELAAGDRRPHPERLQPEHHLLAGPIRGDAALQTEPGGPPARPPGVADAEGAVGPDERFGRADRLPRDVVGRDRERVPGAEHRRRDDVVEHVPGLPDRPVGDHQPLLVSRTAKYS